MVSRALDQQPCQQRCTWAPTGRRLSGLPLFACRSCQTEWTPDQAWTPCNADGVVPTAVQQAVRAHRPGRLP